MTNHTNPTLQDEGTDVLDNDTVVTTVGAPHQWFKRFVPGDGRKPFSTLSVHAVVATDLEYRPYDGLVGRQLKSIKLTLADGTTVEIDLYQAK
jgi:hypothetical protein